MTETSKACSLDSAVARLINLDYVPDGLSVLDMTSAFLEQAESDYENATRASEDASRLASYANVCEARHQLAQHLLVSLELEFARKNSAIARVPDSKGLIDLCEFESIAKWAEQNFSIEFKAGQPVGSGKVKTGTKPADWSQVVVKLYADYRIGVKVDAGSYRNVSFQEIGLMGLRKNEPNEIAGLLLGFALKKKFPKGKSPVASEKTKLSKLRTVLKALTGLNADPFHPITEDRGWEPRFRVIDDRRNADDRAKARSVHFAVDETRDFDVEDDDAQAWLDQHQDD